MSESISTVAEPRNRSERRHPEQLDEGPRAFSVSEVSRRLGISRDSTYQLINSGRLRSVSLGRRRVVSATALAELLDATEEDES